MQQGLPEDLWFFIIIVALLILAYLWNDRGGSSSSGGSGSSSTGGTGGGSGGDDTDPITDPERPPRIHVHSKGSQEPGEEFWIKASFDTGSGQLQNLSAKINGDSVGIRERSEGYFISNPEEVQEGKNVLKASITTDVGTDTDTTGFSATKPSPEDDEGPTVRAEYEIIDEEQGHVRIEAEAHSGTSPVQHTHIYLSSNGEVVGDNGQNSDSCVFEAKNLPNGNYVITAVAKDRNELTGEYTEAFTLKSGTEGGGGEIGGSGGVSPAVFNPQINFEPEINVNVGNGTDSGVGGFDDYSGDNWSIFLQALRDSNIRSDVKEIILDILGGNSNDYSISILWVVRMMQIVESMQKEDVPDAAREVAEYTRTNQIRNISGSYFNALTNLLERRHSLERKPLEMEDNPYEASYREGEIHDFFEGTYRKLKKILEESNKLAEIDEEAIEDFYNAMEVFERERALIQAFAMINQSELREAMESNDGARVKEIVQQAEQRAGVDGKLSDEEFLTEIKRDLEKIGQNVDEAFELLKRADDLISDEHSRDIDIEEALNAFEAAYLDELDETLDVMDRLTDGMR